MVGSVPAPSFNPALPDKATMLQRAWRMAYAVLRWLPAAGEHFVKQHPVVLTKLQRMPPGEIYSLLFSATTPMKELAFAVSDCTIDKVMSPNRPLLVADPLYGKTPNFLLAAFMSRRSSLLSQRTPQNLCGQIILDETSLNARFGGDTFFDKISERIRAFEQDCIKNTHSVIMRLTRTHPEKQVEAGFVKQMFREDEEAQKLTADAFDIAELMFAAGLLMCRVIDGTDDAQSSRFEEAFEEDDSAAKVEAAQIIATKTAEKLYVLRTIAMQCSLPVTDETAYLNIRPLSINVANVGATQDMTMTMAQHLRTCANFFLSKDGPRGRLFNFCVPAPDASPVSVTSRQRYERRIMTPTRSFLSMRDSEWVAEKNIEPPTAQAVASVLGERGTLDSSQRASCLKTCKTGLADYAQLYTAQEASEKCDEVCNGQDHCLADRLAIAEQSGKIASERAKTFAHLCLDFYGGGGERCDPTDDTNVELCKRRVVRACRDADCGYKVAYGKVEEFATDVCSPTGSFYEEFGKEGQSCKLPANASVPSQYEQGDARCLQLLAKKKTEDGSMCGKVLQVDKDESFNDSEIGKLCQENPLKCYIASTKEGFKYYNNPVKYTVALNVCQPFWGAADLELTSQDLVGLDQSKTQCQLLKSVLDRNANKHTKGFELLSNLYVNWCRAQGGGQAPDASMKNMDVATIIREVESNWNSRNYTWIQFQNVERAILREPSLPTDNPIKAVLRLVDASCRRFTPLNNYTLSDVMNSDNKGELLHSLISGTMRGITSNDLVSHYGSHTLKGAIALVYVHQVLEIGIALMQKFDKVEEITKWVNDALSERRLGATRMQFIKEPGDLAFNAIVLPHAVDLLVRHIEDYAAYGPSYQTLSGHQSKDTAFNGRVDARRRLEKGLYFAILLVKVVFSGLDQGGRTGEDILKTLINRNDRSVGNVELSSIAGKLASQIQPTNSLPKIVQTAFMNVDLLYIQEEKKQIDWGFWCKLAFACVVDKSLIKNNTYIESRDKFLMRDKFLKTEITRARACEIYIAIFLLEVTGVGEAEVQPYQNRLLEILRPEFETYAEVLRKSLAENKIVEDVVLAEGTSRVNIAMDRLTRGQRRTTSTAAKSPISTFLKSITSMTAIVAPLVVQEVVATIAPEYATSRWVGVGAAAATTHLLRYTVSTFQSRDAYDFEKKSKIMTDWAIKASGGTPENLTWKKRWFSYEGWFGRGKSKPEVQTNHVQTWLNHKTDEEARVALAGMDEGERKVLTRLLNPLLINTYTALYDLLYAFERYDRTIADLFKYESPSRSVCLPVAMTPLRKSINGNVYMPALYDTENGELKDQFGTYRVNDKGVKIPNEYKKIPKISQDYMSALIMAASVMNSQSPDAADILQPIKKECSSFFRTNGILSKVLFDSRVIGGNDGEGDVEAHESTAITTKFRMQMFCQADAPAMCIGRALSMDYAVPPDARDTCLGIQARWYSHAKREPAEARQLTSRFGDVTKTPWLWLSSFSMWMAGNKPVEGSPIAPIEAGTPVNGDMYTAVREAISGLPQPDRDAQTSAILQTALSIIYANQYDRDYVVAAIRAILDGESGDAQEIAEQFLLRHSNPEQIKEELEKLIEGKADLARSLCVYNCAAYLAYRLGEHQQACLSGRPIARRSTTNPAECFGRMVSRLFLSMLKVDETGTQIVETEDVNVALSCLNDYFNFTGDRPSIPFTALATAKDARALASGKDKGTVAFIEANSESFFPPIG